MEKLDKLKNEIDVLCQDDDKEKALKELRTLTEEEAFRYQCEKFRFYEPNGKCEEFIRRVGEKTEYGHNFIVLFSAANGVGKTCVSANIVAHLIWGKESENPYFNYPLYKDFPFPKKGRIISDPENIKGNLIATLKEWFPEGRYKTRKGSKMYDSLWKTDNGWEFDIMSYEQDAKEFESATLGWIWFDEPPTEAIFKASVSRLRKGGIIFISETPLYASWLYDHIIANPDKDLDAKGQRVYLEADVESACKQHGVRGHLEHEHIERMIAEYSEDEKQARIYGKFQHLVGLRFKQFSRNIHVIRPFEIDYKNYSVYEALDPHPRNPDAVLWVAVDRKGQKFIIDELWLKCQGGTEELVQRIKKKADQYRIERRIIDPSALIVDQHTNRSLHSNLASLGLSYIEASKMRAMSDRRIEDGLTYQKVLLNEQEEFIKTPEFYIFDTCQRTIYEFEHLRWDEWTGKSSENRDKKERAVDKDDHMIENLGRILIQEPQFIPIETNTYGKESGTPNYDPYAR